MKSLVGHVTKAAVLIARLATGVAFLTIIVAVIIQLLGRSGFVPAMIWTEELTRFALLWLTAFGAGLGLRTGALVNVDIISEALPGKQPWMLRLFAAVVTASFALMLISPAALFTKIGARQTAPALGIHMDWIHAAALVTLLVLGIFAILRVIGMIIGTDDGLPTKSAEEL